VTTPPFDPTSADGKKIAEAIKRQESDDVFAQYVGWLEDYFGTTINQAALAQALGGTSDAN